MGVRRSLDQQLGSFLRQKRGGMTCAQFARKLGIAPSTLYRLENGAQSVTLQRLQQIVDRLRCSMADIFHGERSGSS